MNDFKPVSKILKPEELVSKNTPELLQLKKFYEKKIDSNVKYDVFKKPKAWFSKHRKLVLFIILISIIIMLISFYISFKYENTWYGIPAMIALVTVMFMAMVLDDKVNVRNYRNLEQINIMLEVKKDSDKIKTEARDPEKIIEVHNVLKEIGEGNFAVILKKLTEKGKPISEKTLRKILNEDLKKIVSFKYGKFNSISRTQSNAKIYYINDNKK